MSAPHRSNLDGLRVLVVEDEYLAARFFESTLRNLGCKGVGPVSSADEACDLIKANPVDVAILDINLSPGTCEPIARALRYRDLPFIFITGYSNLNMLPDDLRGHRILTKPTDAATIETVMREIASERRKRAQA
jgi:DNA-binding NtrC family response regulator